MTRLIDGRAIAAGIAEQTAKDVAGLTQTGVIPTLAVVVATDDEGAAWYVRSLEGAAAKLGVACQVRQLGKNADRADVIRALDDLSQNGGVHGIMCQTPLPDGIDLEMAGSWIDVAKDVDGANPQSLGMLAAGVPGAFAPATVAAVAEILRRENVPLLGRRVVVVGRSNVVGKPAALLLLEQHATVTICHSRTVDLAAECRQADVLVVAVGQPAMIGADYVRPGAVVIDVGTNPTDNGGLVGDVDTDAVVGIAAAVTPVPGGVGPVTTMLMMRNTVTAARNLAEGP